MELKVDPELIGQFFKSLERIILDGIERVMIFSSCYVYHVDNPWWNWKLNTAGSSTGLENPDNPWWNWK